MNEFIDSRWWFCIALVGYLCALGLSFQAEHTYRKIFALPQMKFRHLILPSLLGLAALAPLAFYLDHRYPTAVVACFAIACGALVGVYRIDSILLVIPDRLQVLGTISSLLFLAVIAISGEDLSQLALEVLFALVMVILLWGLSYVYLRLRGTIGFGMGDIKLLGWLALFTGKRMPDLILFAIGFGFLSLLLPILKQLISERKLRLPKGQEAFAFGPSIVLAFFLEELIYYADHQ